jgi:hypothetical protein
MGEAMLRRAHFRTRYGCEPSHSSENPQKVSAWGVKLCRKSSAESRVEGHQTDLYFVRFDGLDSQFMSEMLRPGA